MKGLQFSAGSIKELLLKQGLFPQEQPSAGQQPIPRTVRDETSTFGSNPKLRVEQFIRILAADCIDMQQLRGMAYHGVPDGSDVAQMAPNLRQTVWKLLLGLLPRERAQWEAAAVSKRKQYEQYCQELILDPSSFRGGAVALLGEAYRQKELATRQDAEDLSLAAAAVREEDHPLSQAQGSKWAMYFKDAEVLEQIDRDVMRTHPDMHFFSGDDPAATLHREEMKRALFIFAKLNPGLTYVQGMNELYAPLYYLFKCDTTRGASTHAEADAFFCFVDLMSEFRDNFCQQLDNSTVGIRATLNGFAATLARVDPQVANHLESTGVKPQFYAFRWITLLLTQELAFPELYRLWDTLLSDPRGRLDCLLRVCLAMLVHVRDDLLACDMSAAIKLLQKYPPCDVSVLLDLASTLVL